MTNTVLITGCSSGLGKTTARHFATQGWNVIATMRKPDQSLAAGHADQMLVLPLDVTDPASIEAAIAAGIERFGHINAVVNNAGISVVSIFEATAKETIRGIFETNVFGMMNVMQAAIPHLRDQGGGTIINITSGVGLAAVPLLALYTATKHAVEGLSESLSYELESQNILVKLVEPGAMRTTSFTSNTMTASEAVSVPATYKPYFYHMMQSMMNYPFPDADEQRVVATIFAAATDPSHRLRYLAGPDTEEMARLRWSTSEDEYLSTMNRLMGQTAWRDGNAS
ncbi:MULTISPECIES: SDR family oxidoreductase [unclassified Mesorhizobium]|jgi:NAD(P)-dependent dehydrogenase (short-subunit alcohol dehydrogenase family)|uniref:SDR family oxidoreductase n=1 Tax=unclassified Mesorhizobium TaxID=325217 RepID=UPI000FCC73DD|nr:MULTISPECIES: SDR family oxidoreductase [unclassified Mesorhizobium]RUX92502.1 SDR family oxidoreductase [Mesorhizobium sp. M7D.F.Ca.US.004.01.2.1]RVA26347.1 SDR family oxidoreductase [Mesorhizobium sp. M7D.F.Ca.US.004.03.1.1]